MRSKVKVIANEYEWHRWFAWRPVRISAGKMRQWVWLETVWRIFISGYDGHDTVYLLIGEDKEVPHDPRG